MVVSAEKARERAEARRLRILAKANERLDVVSGLVPSDKGDTAASVESPADSPRENVADVSKSTPTAAASEEKENKGSKRMAAMRRRRQQLKAAKVEEERDAATNVHVEGNAKTEKGHDEAKEAKNETMENAHVVSSDEKDGNDVISTKDSSEDTAIQQTETNESSPNKPSSDETSPDEPKKTYVGVAKMRRRILKEQKAQRLQSIADSEALHQDPHMERELAAEMAVMGVTAKMVREGMDICGETLGDGVVVGNAKKKKGLMGRFIPSMPVLSRLITLMVLFGTGLRLGIETHRVGVVDESSPAMISNESQKMIHHVESELTKPWEYGMGGKMAYMVGKIETAPPTALPTSFYDDSSCFDGDESRECKAKAKQFKSADKPEQQKINLIDMEDEFDTGRARPRGVTSEFDDLPKAEPNIDPLFRADLDELLSKSALPFPIDYAAKFAIRFHRMWIYYLWTLPSSMIKTVTSAPKNILGGWIRYPPVVLIFTLLIRAGNKVLLGGGKKLEDDGEKDKNKGGFDVMKKVMDSAKTYVEGTFPWLVFILKTLYDVVKVDMYVVFCGLMVGLVMPLHGLSLGFGDGKVLGDGEL